MLSKYKIIRFLGRGVYGDVHLVQAQDGAQKVLKQVHLELFDEGAKEDARNEIKIMKQLNHPNIISYYESFEEEKNLNIIMEYADGGDLNQKIRKMQKDNRLDPKSRKDFQFRIMKIGELFRKFSSEEVWKFISQISQAMDYIHSKRILHRDVKPQNIFLDCHGNVKLGDFGLGRALEASLHAETTVGTPLYFSPELCQGMKYCAKTDIWSLGVIIYQLLTFKLPFTAASQLTLCSKICSQAAPSLPQDCDSGLKNLVNRMLYKDPVKRISAQEILQIEKVQIQIIREENKTMKLLMQQKDDIIFKRDEEIQEKNGRIYHLERLVTHMDNDRSIAKKKEEELNSMLKFNLNEYRQTVNETRDQLCQLKCETLKAISHISQQFNENLWTKFDGNPAWLSKRLNSICSYADYINLSEAKEKLVNKLIHKHHTCERRKCVFQYLLDKKSTFKDYRINLFDLGLCSPDGSKVNKSYSCVLSWSRSKNGSAHLSNTLKLRLSYPCSRIMLVCSIFKMNIHECIMSKTLKIRCHETQFYHTLRNISLSSIESFSGSNKSQLYLMELQHDEKFDTIDIDNEFDEIIGVLFDKELLELAALSPIDREMFLKALYLKKLGFNKWKNTNPCKTQTA